MSDHPLPSRFLQVAVTLLYPRGATARHSSPSWQAFLCLLIGCVCACVYSLNTVRQDVEIKGVSCSLRLLIPPTDSTKHIPQCCLTYFGGDGRCPPSVNFPYIQGLTKHEIFSDQANPKLLHCLLEVLCRHTVRSYLQMTIQTRLKIFTLYHEQAPDNQANYGIWATYNKIGQGLIRVSCVVDELHASDSPQAVSQSRKLACLPGSCSLSSCKHAILR